MEEEEEEEEEEEKKKKKLNMYWVWFLENWYHYNWAW